MTKLDKDRIIFIAQKYTGKIYCEQTYNQIKNEIEDYIKCSVICDETNNTPETIDNNELILDVIDKTSGEIRFKFTPTKYKI